MIETDQFDTTVLPLALTLAHQLKDVSYLQKAALQLVQFCREHAVAYFALGCLSATEGQHEAAINMFARAFSLKDPFPEVALCMGVSYEKSADWDNAV